MKESFLHLHLKKQIVSQGQYQDKLEKIICASLNMAGEQRKWDLFYEKKLSERSWVTEARKMLPMRASDLILVCHTLTAFVRCLLVWSHVLTDCERGCGSWMLSCVLYTSTCGCLRAESFSVYLCISFLQDNKILLWWHQKLLYWLVLCGVWGALSLGKWDIWVHVFLIHKRISCFPADTDIFQCLNFYQRDQRECWPVTVFLYRLRLSKLCFKVGCNKADFIKPMAK